MDRVINAMKLHWSPRSPFVRKVMIFAHETGLVDRLECVRTVVAMTTANVDLLTDNLLSKIPTLILDDGTVLYDSAVICEYLDSLHGGSKLFPPDGPARWTALRRQALGDGFLDLLILWRYERQRAQPLQSVIDAFSANHHDIAGAGGLIVCKRPVRDWPHRDRLQSVLS
jgi:glutathione S-transferase